MTTVVRANKILLRDVHEAAAAHPVIGSSIQTDADAVNASLLAYSGLLRDLNHADALERRRELARMLRGIADEVDR